MFAICNANCASKIGNLIANRNVTGILAWFTAKATGICFVILQETDLPRHKGSFDIQKALLGQMIPMLI
jgi:hypothetical protein